MYAICIFFSNFAQKFLDKPSGQAECVMNIQDLENLYAQLPQVSALAKELGKSSSTMIFLDGLVGSSAPMLFASLIKKCRPQVLFILQDAEEAGYFYHDLTQLLGDNDVLFFPSSYRRAIKYAQRDAASEILRTEVLARLTSGAAGYIVTYPRRDGGLEEEL